MRVNMAKDITVVGTGYVGLVAAIGLADFGNNVIGVDIDKEKINKLKEGISPIYEKGIEEYLKRNLESKRLKFSTEIEKAIQGTEVVFIGVGTPEKENGEADLTALSAVVDVISNNLNGYKVVVTKSTVPLGTNRWIKERIKEISGSDNFDVVSNPEFLREGVAVHDFFHPDRIVLGVESEKAKEIMQEIYRSLYLIETPFIWCNLETAELIKYSSNAFLATKITFINQIANLCEKVGADVHVVSKAMGKDGRISSKFLHPGPGYGGSCFPKDTKALVKIGEQFDVEMSLVGEVISANEKQKQLMVSKLESLLGTFYGKTVAVLGLAFKAETDDIRESPAIVIINALLKKGAHIKTHDPKATENMKELFGNKIEYCNYEFDAVQDADALIIVTEWNEYRNLDLEKAKKIMSGNIVVDTRNVLNKNIVKKLGFTYLGVGRS